ncbi:hypothetical protein R3W88_019497 [Solanum pinnatisectum]|uniref:Uncharacterized protein n=1 Tax=Solanum pinnatisectum TaxID=50273 RepID=A0AAV9KJH1_9SOLN|nr:hypothetical protein R3W88_019497 [Solanum pinnatisectum]
MAHAHGALVLVDNNNISINSTKFISSYNDLMVGVLSVRGERFFLYFAYISKFDLLLSYDCIFIVFYGLLLFPKPIITLGS